AKRKCPFVDRSTYWHRTIPHPSSLIPHPSSLIPHPSSRIPHPASRIRIPVPIPRASSRDDYRVEYSPVFDALPALLSNRRPLSLRAVRTPLAFFSFDSRQPPCTTTSSSLAAGITAS